MSETDVNKMDFKQLRNEVQLLRDELALFKRKSEDLLYNLDADNFSGGFRKEQDNMKAQMKITAEAIKLMVSDTDLQKELQNYSTIEMTSKAITAEVSKVNENLKSYSTIEMTSKAITAEVSKVNENLKSYSTIEMTAKSITDTVSAEYINTRIGDTYVNSAKLKSELQTTEEGIFATVSQTYETKDDAGDAYDDLRSSITSISVTADSLTTTVTNLDNFNTSVFKQSADEGFVLDGVKVKATGYITLTDNGGVERFSISHDESQVGGAQILLHCLTQPYSPIVLGNGFGDSNNVYVGGTSDINKVATQGWVQDNAGSYAKFS